MTTQIPATAEVEKWLRIRVRIRSERKKNTESWWSRLLQSGSAPTSDIYHMCCSSCTRDGTDQQFCSPARPELTWNCPAWSVYAKLQHIFWPGLARGPSYEVGSIYFAAKMAAHLSLVMEEKRKIMFACYSFRNTPIYT